MDGDVIEDATMPIAVLSPLPDGRRLDYPLPDPITLYLFEAKHASKRAAETLRRTRASIARGPEGVWSSGTPSGFLDFVGAASAAVVLASASVEAFANGVVFGLTDEESITVPGRSKPIPVGQIERPLSTAEKLRYVVHLFEDGRDIFGTEHWTHFEELNALRNELVHVKRLGSGALAKARPFRSLP